jgi:YD repeat-containing protein
MRHGLGIGSVTVLPSEAIEHRLLPHPSRRRGWRQFEYCALSPSPAFERYAVEFPVLSDQDARSLSGSVALLAREAVKNGLLPGSTRCRRRHQFDYRVQVRRITPLRAVERAVPADGQTGDLAVFTVFATDSAEYGLSPVLARLCGRRQLECRSAEGCAINRCVGVSTTMDGLGRTTKTETGYNNTTLSTVDTQYVPCGCSPLGKIGRQSQPYAPGQTEYWTIYTYDGLGRTTSVLAPDGASTTTYQYAGNTVTVTDPAGKWKQFTMDALGNLTGVLEPGSGQGSGGTAASFVKTAASFVKMDTTTQGNWHGVYGADGYNVIGDQASNPSYVTPVASGQSLYTWASSTSDPDASLNWPCTTRLGFPEVPSTGGLLGRSDYPRERRKGSFGSRGNRNNHVADGRVVGLISQGDGAVHAITCKRFPLTWPARVSTSSRWSGSSLTDRRNESS